MAQRFYNTTRTAFMVILSVLVVIQRVDALPSKLPGYYSYDDETKPTAADSSNHPDFTLSGSEKPEDDAEIAREMKTIHYSESSASYSDGRSETAVVEISQKKQATRHNDEKPITHERRSWDRDSAEDDDEEDDDDFDEDENNNNYTSNAEKELSDLIDNALKKHLLISPKDLDALLGTNNDESTPVRFQKPRPPAPSQNTFTHPIEQPVYDPKWVFPDQVPPKRPTPVKSAPRCDNSTFCLEPSFYLSDADIDNALSLRYLEPISDPAISERMGPDDDDNGLCSSYKHTIPPKTALADDNKWYFILNNEKYEQLVHVELCKDPDTVCSLIEGFSAGYTTTCKQKYIHRQLVAVEKAGDPAQRHLFEMPSSCCCHVKFTGTPAQRLGGSPFKNN